MGVLAVDPSFWRGRRVLLTGHTGFKGAWALAMLRTLGAEVHGFALEAPTEPNAFGLLGLESACAHRIADIRDAAAIEEAVRRAAPEVVIHMAAQALVRASYDDPLTTYAVNVMGTANILEACRRTEGVRSVVVVTTDKCYENREWRWGYREIDRLGGHDPYSNSKAAAELVVSAYRESFFRGGPIRLASARAGNVIGGGDFAVDRLVPDAIRAFAAGRDLRLRNPLATRPWQHVLEPVAGYLMLVERLHNSDRFADGWNFGPASDSEATVGQVADRLVTLWGGNAAWSLDDGAHPHEATMLRLDATRARLELGWTPRLDLDAALRLTCEWYRAHVAGGDLAQLTERQITNYLNG